MSLVIWLCIPSPGKPCWVLEYSALLYNFVQVMLLLIKLYLYRGLTLCLMVGPWSGTRPRPTRNPPSDAMPGQAWHPYWRRVLYRTLLSLFTLKLISFCNNFPMRKILYFELSCNITACDVKCDGPCISGLAFVRSTLLWSCFRWFIGTLPDRPKGYTVWSTPEPAKMVSRTWAGVIQVGSATAGIRANKCTLEM
jgi:hypothetical protein